MGCLEDLVPYVCVFLSLVILERLLPCHQWISLTGRRLRRFVAFPEPHPLLFTLILTAPECWNIVHDWLMPWVIPKAIIPRSPRLHIKALCYMTS